MNDIWNIDSEDFYKAKNSQEKIKFLLRYAILAPSTHNCQPWLFKIGDNYCEIYQNKLIQLPEADKTGRDMYISFGCLIENISISAHYYNIKFDLKYILDEKKNLIAKIKFLNLKALDNTNNNDRSLLNAIINRQTVRGKFDNRSISEEIINRLVKLNKYLNISTDYITDREDILKLSQLTSQGMIYAYKSKQFRHEMAKWFRTNLSQRKEGLPGYALGMPTFLSLIFPTLVRYFDIGNKVSALNYISISSAPMICILSSKKNDKNTWLEIGRLSQRIMLILVSYDIKISIFVAAIEMGELYKDVQKILKTDDIPQFLFCAGYMNVKQKHTKRYLVEEKIID